MRKYRLACSAIITAGFLTTTDPVAQSYWCDRPDEPDIPSGRYADWDEMEEAEAEVEDFISEMNDYRECLSNELDDATREAEWVIDEWSDAVSDFNNR